MKHAVSISIGSSKRNKAVEVNLLGETVRIERIGTDGDMEAAAKKYQELDGTVDAFGVGGRDLTRDPDPTHGRRRRLPDHGRGRQPLGPEPRQLARSVPWRRRDCGRLGLPRTNLARARTLRAGSHVRARGVGSHEAHVWKGRGPCPSGAARRGVAAILYNLSARALQQLVSVGSARSLRTRGRCAQ